MANIGQEREGRRANYDPEIPSVTELLTEAGYGYDGPPDTTGYYRRRGIWVNDCADIVAQRRPLDEWQRAENDRVRTKPLTKKDETKFETWGGYVIAVENWLKHHPEAELVESQKYVRDNSLMYQGTLDWVMALKEGLVLIDLKALSTGPAPKWTALQTAGYDIATRPRSHKRMGLAVHADGTFTECTYRNYRDYDAFRNLVEHHWTHGVGSEYR